MIFFFGASFTKPMVALTAADTLSAQMEMQAAWRAAQSHHRADLWTAGVSHR